MRTGLFLDVVIGRVAVTEFVDEFGLQCFVGEERPAIDQRADVVGGHFSGLGDSRDDLAELRVHDLSVASLNAGVYFVSVKLVHGVFVFGAVVHARDEPEFVERAAHKRRLGHQAGQPDIAGRLQVNPVESGGEVIRPVGLAGLRRTSRRRRWRVCRCDERQ
jgi:hypothetical protein